MHDIQCACRRASSRRRRALAMASCTEAPRYGSAARATLPARRCTSHGTVSGCPPTLAGPAAALGAALWGGDTRRNRRVRATPNTRRVGAYGRSGWFIVGAKACDAPRQQQRQRDRSSGRDDVSGCSRPCLIAFYDLQRPCYQFELEVINCIIIVMTSQ